VADSTAPSRSSRKAEAVEGGMPSASSDQTSPRSTSFRALSAATSRFARATCSRVSPPSCGPRAERRARPMSTACSSFSSLCSTGIHEPSLPRKEDGTSPMRSSSQCTWSRQGAARPSVAPGGVMRATKYCSIASKQRASSPVGNPSGRARSRWSWSMRASGTISPRAVSVSYHCA